MDRRWRKAGLTGAALLATLGAGLGLHRCGGTPGSPMEPIAGLSPTPPTTGSSADSTTDLGPSLRMRSLVFRFDARGVTLAQSTSLAGRVKAPPRSVAADRLEFVAFDAGGREVFSGALDHPLHRRLEYESSGHPGQLESVATSVAENLFPLRLPAEPRAARVAFYEVRAGRDGRQPLGESILP